MKLADPGLRPPTPGANRIDPPTFRAATVTERPPATMPARRHHLIARQVHGGCHKFRKSCELNRRFRESRAGEGIDDELRLITSYRESPEIGVASTSREKRPTRLDQEREARSGPPIHMAIQSQSIEPSVHFRSPADKPLARTQSLKKPRLVTPPPYPFFRSPSPTSQSPLRLVPSHACYSKL